MDTGIALARAYHREVVGPLLSREVPRLPHAAGRLGSGSDVLGFDDATSRDHDWGLRLTLLVDDADADLVPYLDDLLERELPDRFRGHPVRFAMTWDERARHKVSVATVPAFARDRLGIAFDPADSAGWLMLTGQAVLEVIAGPVFADTTTALGPLRAALRHYPAEVERYVLAAGWHRLARLPLHARAAATGQPLHARRLAGTLAEDVMRQAFRLCRAWAPYDKWFERAFQRLPIAAELTGPLTTVLHSVDPRVREDALVTAVRVLLARQRDLGLPTPPDGVGPFFERASRAVRPEVPAALLDGLTDPLLRRLPPEIGAIDQWLDNPWLLARPEARAAFAAAYEQWLRRA
ncbi:DUF4037 domain-containing protein [Catenuloplanes atrovinosus]|uniref:DUF4037 domain-containing protein n=1 Tax=Catenuloplanes atrovinosus TaxID=137266 RepID=A0AAE4CCE3_9ACTN|nr:DUF4037 domain-containing protein [Catenuloplanes atrovinosus]MDR7277889.1 hypothetical protein [Catenuloplanes atrovinosus]